VRIGPPKAAPLTNKKETTGAEQAIRPHNAVVNVLIDGFKRALLNQSRLKRKNVFFAGRGVFFLSHPLMGDPIPLNSCTILSIVP